MLCKPISAFCDNRAPAPKHPSSGEPDEWLADTYLEPHGLVGLTFDFFVNWTTRSVSKRLWMKRIVNQSFMPWPITSSHDPSKAVYQNAIYQCDGEEKVKQLCKFATKYGMSCHYFLFQESDDWENSPSPIVAVSFNGDGLVVDDREVELPTLKSRIQQWAGGTVYVGRKGLGLGSSTLECYLANARTGAAWPGDADLVLVDSNVAPHAIIEFKKHTLETPIADQKLSNYYRRGKKWSQDGRKYNRLAMLRDYLSGSGPPLPIIVVYFPTSTSIHHVKLEYVEGADRELIATKSKFVLLPNAGDEGSCRDFVALLLEFIAS